MARCDSKSDASGALTEIFQRMAPLRSLVLQSPEAQLKLLSCRLEPDDLATASHGPSRPKGGAQGPFPCAPRGRKCRSRAQNSVPQREILRAEVIAKSPETLGDPKP